MKIAEMIDYAPHLEELKKLLREAHDLVNDHKYKETEETAFKLLVEAKLFLNAIRHNG